MEAITPATLTSVPSLYEKFLLNLLNSPFTNINGTIRLSSSPSFLACVDSRSLLFQHTHMVGAGIGGIILISS